MDLQDAFAARQLMANQSHVGLMEESQDEGGWNGGEGLGFVFLGFSEVFRVFSVFFPTLRNHYCNYLALRRMIMMSLIFCLTCLNEEFGKANPSWVWVKIPGT